MQRLEHSILTEQPDDPLLRSSIADLQQLRLVLTDLDRTIAAGKPDRSCPLGAIWRKVERLNVLTRQMGFEFPLLSMSTLCLWPLRPGLKESDTFCCIEFLNRAMEHSEESLFRGDESTAEIAEFRERVLEALRSWITDIDIRLTEITASWSEARVPSPYPERTDVRLLWGWAYRMDGYIRSGLSLSRWSAAYVLPDSRAAEAINRLSIQYPAIIRQIQDHLDDAKRCLDRIGEDELSQDHLREAMWVLKDRIYAGAATIAQVELPDPGRPASIKTHRGDGNKRADTIKVQRRLERMERSGTKYTSMNTLAGQLKCSKTTIHNAIHRSPRLKKWAQVDESVRRTPRAQSLSEVVLQSAASPVSDDPANLLHSEDVDLIMAQLIAQAKPEEQARLNSLSCDERRRMAALYEEHIRDDEPPALSFVTSHRQRRQKCHKRV